MLEYDQIVALLSDSDNATSYGPGKFEGCADARIAEALYEATLDGWCDDQRGSVDEVGWYGLIGRFIVEEDSQGFFDYEAFDSEREAERTFRTIEA